MFGTSIRMSSRVARLTTSLLEFFGSMSSVLCTQADIAHIAFDLSRSMIVVLNFCPRGSVCSPSLQAL
ncbi:hypothetical protein PGT21_019344 [Puccinia graminis f. sp. tritici]|uniref:Uncharacterized protein n=1 Tax=Puccinia graminis f. sp. tritici TaxID=56615 RepID=A0A5B0LLX1_PUCGR|nr:hypothetical protein PGT21_019344 [Puccinia graminis f. sp. tritici]